MTTDVNQTRNNRLVLLMIAGIPLTMILAASWLWYFVVKGDLDLVGALGTGNRGELVRPPRQLDDVALSEQTGASIRYAVLAPAPTGSVESIRSAAGSCVPGRGPGDRD